MSAITIVTGPLRSGTSCVTGMLERCGFNLGQHVRILRNETPMNPKGHFEPDLLYAINERLLVETPGGIWNPLCPPPEKALSELAFARERYFQLFIRKFDGELCKDPLFCLTLPFWERHWPELHRAIFCLRHPLAVAYSMHQRYMISLERGVELWQTYTMRFFQSHKRSQVFVLDFDAFTSAPVSTFDKLLNWLERPLPQQELLRRFDGFFDTEYVHWNYGAAELETIPVDIRDLYATLRSQAGML